MLPKKRGLILALDVTERSRALDIANKVYKYVDAIKLNYPVVLSTGIEIIRQFTGKTYVLCDFKVADIPNTNRLIAELAFGHGASGIIVHAFPGTDSVLAVKEVAEKYSGDVFLVVEMSNPGGVEFTSKHAYEFADMAKGTGLRGIIAPATRPERIQKFREIIGDDLLILSPGVGAQGGDARSAYEAGADYIIVGRSIYDAADPELEAKKLHEIIAQF
jgi:orotidine-5'-phosphate decarboxylase